MCARCILWLEEKRRDSRSTVPSSNSLLKEIEISSPIRFFSGDIMKGIL